VSCRFRAASGTVEFTDSVLALFRRHRQRHFWSCEAGGQLFFRPDESVFRVGLATGPGRHDRCSPFSFWPNRAREQQDIQRFFPQGLHYIGDWHSHPEDNPSPSDTDINKMLAIFRESDHQLPFMLLVVVGRSSDSGGLWVGTVNREGVAEATAISGCGSA